MVLLSRLVYLMIAVVLSHCLSSVLTDLDLTTARRRPDFDGKIVPETRVLWKSFYTDGSMCVGECNRDLSCVSVFLNKVTGQCQGHSMTVSDIEDTFDEADSRLYVLARGEQYIGDTCTSITDCITPDSQCYNGTCICMHGYSLKPTAHQCVPGCDVYGADFMEYKNAYIVMYTTETIYNCSLSDCMASCRNRTDYMCRSLEYMWSDQNCYLTNVTYLDHPGQWYVDIDNYYNISYFQRDCE